MQQRLRRRRRRITVAAEMPETIVSLGYIVFWGGGSCGFFFVFFVVWHFDSGASFPSFSPFTATELLLLPRLLIYIIYILDINSSLIQSQFRHRDSSPLVDSPWRVPAHGQIESTKGGRSSTTQERKKERKKEKKLHPSSHGHRRILSDDELKDDQSSSSSSTQKQNTTIKKSIADESRDRKGEDGKVHPARQKIEEEEKSVSPTRNRTLISGRRPSPAPLLSLIYAAVSLDWAPPRHHRAASTSADKQERALSLTKMWYNNKI